MTLTKYKYPILSQKLSQYKQVWLQCNLALKTVRKVLLSCATAEIKYDDCLRLL